MTIRTTYAAESWDKVYSAFSQINFTAYDYDTVKESLLQYLKIYHNEHFNDFIESSELIAILELFAYVAELLAYRVDTMAHENFITTAQRKQSILRLAKLISYRAARNIPARGLVKINSVRTTEDVFDSLGVNLANTTIIWNDPNNDNWKEQFFLVMGKTLTSRFGQPSKSYQISDVLMQQYTFANNLSSFRNGVSAFVVTGVTEQLYMEVVPADIDENGPYERAPDPSAQFNIIYAVDGKGDGSDYTGFLMFVKQGSLLKTNYDIQDPVVNRRLELDAVNVNDTDVWVYRVDESETIIENWTRVETLFEQNLQFNELSSTRKKYEIETLENDRIALIFGDNNFADAPVGNFQIWTRTSVNQSVMIPKNRIVRQTMRFNYQNATNNTHEVNLTFSLTSALQNNAPAESIEHIRQSAPSTYYAQNRMVNGQDYNTFMLKDSTILRLKTINRTFAGQPKYIEWNDASGAYENVKIFGDDLSIFMQPSVDQIETQYSSKTLIDSFIEPLLQQNQVQAALTHALAASPNGYGIMTFPRRKFIEDNRLRHYAISATDGSFIPVSPYGKTLNGVNVQLGDGSLNEKSVIQSALDRHWYGDPISYVDIGGNRHGVIPDRLISPEDDGRLYLDSLPRTIDGINTYPPGDIGSGLQPLAPQPAFGLRFNPFLKAFGDGVLTLFAPNHSALINNPRNKMEVFTIEMLSDGSTFSVISNLRGKLPNYSLSAISPIWTEQTSQTLPFDFKIELGSKPFEAGDSFIVEVVFNNNLPQVQLRNFGTESNIINSVNLSGWWELIPDDVITGALHLGGAGLFVDSPADGPNELQRLMFDPNHNALSWMFLIARNDNSLGQTVSWSVYNRSVKLIAESKNTRFWHNQNTQILDPETKKPVFDKIRILRSNLDETKNPFIKAHVYDVVDFSYDADGNINFNQLEIIPTDTENFIQDGDKTPDNILQFESFSQDSFEYFLIDVSGAKPVISRSLTCADEYTLEGYDVFDYDIDSYDSLKIRWNNNLFTFTAGNFLSDLIPDAPNQNYRLGRRKRVPAPVALSISNISECNPITGLDFMWQHFSPRTHLIDPSVSNIHDTYIITTGYHASMIEYVKGLISLMPEPPTPLDLRTSYGYLLKNKMLSDTVVFHPGKIKLLFGNKADQRLRAKFRVIKNQQASFSDERIKQEIVIIIDTFFDIKNWDFGDTFYATELLALIHQRLPTQIASVVLVPMHSSNSFGSLFTIESGIDEVLQSAATVDEIEIIDALTPTMLRQLR